MNENETDHSAVPWFHFLPHQLLQTVYNWRQCHKAVFNLFTDQMWVLENFSCKANRNTHNVCVKVEMMWTPLWTGPKWCSGTCYLET